MPAFLIRNGKQVPYGLPRAVEQIRCTKYGCEISYTIYSNEPISMYGSEKSVDVMRRMAVERVEGGHSNHGTKEFYWKGPADGWCESDTPEQRKNL
jgi:hypothetical protein